MTPRRIIDPARLAGSTLLRTQTDERLVDLIRAGNLAAFDAVVRRYRAELLRYCSRLLPASRAEDAVQQTFMSAHAAVAAGSEEFALRAWLYRVAHNHAVTMLRQNGWDNDPLTEDAHGWGESPDAVHERCQDLRAVIDAVAGLPQRQRDALVLRELDGRSYEDIAEQLGVSGGAVRQLVMRARSTLRAGLSAVTPPAILARLTDNAAGAGATASVATVAAGAAGGAGFAQAGAAALAAVAIVAGAVTTTGDTARARAEHPQEEAPSPGGAAGNALSDGAAQLVAAADPQATRRAQRDDEREGGRTRSVRRERAAADRDERPGAGPDSPAAGDPDAPGGAQPSADGGGSSRAGGGHTPERDDADDDEDDRAGTGGGSEDDDESPDAADPEDGDGEAGDPDRSDDADRDSADTEPAGGDDDGADDNSDEEDDGR